MLAAMDVTIGVLQEMKKKHSEKTLPIDPQQVMICSSRENK